MRLSNPLKCFVCSCARKLLSDPPLLPAALQKLHVTSSAPSPTPTPPPSTHVSVCHSYLCLLSNWNLLVSGCSLADVVQSHGGVFMDSSYPSSPVTGPLCRVQRRASEVSIASQVSGMADSYTATNIANSKCSPSQKDTHSLSLSSSLPLHSHSLRSTHTPLALSLSLSLPGLVHICVGHFFYLYYF